MATKKQKEQAFKDAIEITKEHARSDKATQPRILSHFYKEIIQIIDEIEKGDD